MQHYTYVFRTKMERNESYTEWIVHKQQNEKYVSFDERNCGRFRKLFHSQRTGYN